jgi:hypothetical protein
MSREPGRVEEWSLLWQLTRRMATSGRIQTDDARREPFQLTAAVLVYHRPALTAFGDGALHELVRQDPGRVEDLLGLSERQGQDTFMRAATLSGNRNAKLGLSLDRERRKDH